MLKAKQAVAVVSLLALSIPSNLLLPSLPLLLVCVSTFNNVRSTVIVELRLSHEVARWEESWKQFMNKKTMTTKKKQMLTTSTPSKPCNGKLWLWLFFGVCVGNLSGTLLAARRHNLKLDFAWFVSLFEEGGGEKLKFGWRELFAKGRKRRWRKGKKERKKESFH